MMYLVNNYPLASTLSDRYIILKPEDLYQLSREHKKMLDPIIGTLNMIDSGVYKLITANNSSYFLDIDPTLYNYVNSLSSNELISNNLYKVSVDTEKTLFSAMWSLPQYKGLPSLERYLADISNYTIDTQLYSIYRNVLKFRFGDMTMDDQSIIDAYNALQQQLLSLENTTTAEILTKLLEVSDKINGLSIYLSSLRPESNMYKLTSGLIESFNHLVDVCTANTQQAQ